MKIVAMMKRIVPEFKSENSIYEELDTLNTITDNQAEIKSEIKSKNESNKYENAMHKNQIVYSNKKVFPIGKKFSLIH